MVNQVIKVAFVARVYGHLEAFHLPYIRLLQDKGYEVHAYAGADHGKAGVEAQGVICHDTPFYRSAASLKNIRVLKDLRASFQSEGFKLVHCHTPIAGLVARLAAWRADVPVVMYTAHGFHFSKGGPLAYWISYYPIERLAARLTDYLITINQEDYHLAQGFPVRRQVIYTPGIGLDTEEYHAGLPNGYTRAELKLRYGISPQDFLILFVGELNSNKNQIQLIKAAENLVHRHEPVQCFLAGTGSDRTLLEHEVKQRGLQSYVHFLGFRRDIPDLLEAADVVVLLSRREGLPKALMEGMAAGKPIVATNVRGCRDLVVDGETGFLVPVGDTEATVEALRRLLKDEELRKEFGRRNQERVQQYDIRRLVKIMEGIYDQALR